MGLINPTEAILKHFLAQPTITGLVGVQIAQQHKFALEGSDGAWPTPSRALTIRPEPGGTPERDQPNQQGRVVLFSFGGTPAEAMRLYLEVIQVCRAITKATVTTSTGTALIFYLVPDGSPQVAQDADTRVDVVIQSARYRVFEHALEDLT
jgi:hypothetical protein